MLEVFYIDVTNKYYVIFHNNLHKFESFMDAKDFIDDFS